MKNLHAPLYDALMTNIGQDPISFHVPGHKYGRVFYNASLPGFQSVLEMDATEVTGLDDLHAPEGVIKEAQDKAGEFFGSDETFFLVNGTTVGNLALILSVCQQGDQVIVQRNCHKSVLNGLELAGASPVFVSPSYESETNRYSKVTAASIEAALKKYPDSKAVILTYPDYFGRTFDLGAIAERVHHYDLPLLIDEAHGVQFQLGGLFPSTALEAGADAVVQSAHKMSPAMTMASYLHVKGKRVSVDRVRHYLQMLQSSSPSYPLMASLDLARSYMETWTKADEERLISFIKEIRELFNNYESFWTLLPSGPLDDPLKLTLEPEEMSGYALSEAFESEGIIPEMAVSHQLLLVLGLEPTFSIEELKTRLSAVESKLKKEKNHATIKQDQISFPPIQTLEWSYSYMQTLPEEIVGWERSVGRIASEAVIPYPPGIPLILKGERISKQHYKYVQLLIEQGARFQNATIEKGIRVFKGE
ncbi:aminotransferase class I/II-fold pyridoxal phosphate-dependent enzyme [Halobacillus litoralis]|uniref:aminotransferase class I/II-fold pyridoxal phosphate-dependent enzyme n=1 Tax=Halobacillus litoralis TaxID=45668 RepID=UPI001CFD11B2|nr:aminotransferase class I/II-fold pyridoxal phosphate-dependent enzyme [Halobacillus litoralis]